MAESPPRNRLELILRRKRLENRRRRRFSELYKGHPPNADADASIARLRRNGLCPHVIAEVKFRSPSAGAFRARQKGDVLSIASSYVRGGASAISVLADGPGFGGSPLNVRRVASLGAPVLFKEFVLEELQLDIALTMGAKYVLLIVRALEVPALKSLVEGCGARGLVPVVEAASGPELDIALDTGASLIGFNARDLSTFEVDPAAAEREVERIPEDRVAIYMSGIRSKGDFARVAAGRADAVLVGEGLMREGDPESTLKTWRSALETP